MAMSVLDIPRVHIDAELDRQAVFRKMCLIRQFELRVIEATRQGAIPAVVYLSIGQEAVSATLSELTAGFAVFAQHRCHSVYLAHGGTPVRLRDELLGLPTGCCGGVGGSPSAQDLSIPMIAYHGLIGENVSLGTGYSLATQRPVIIYFGDGAAEEDYVLSSLGFAATHDLPVLYVCEDNGLAILTPIKDRRTWKIDDVARSMGLATASVDDNPEAIYHAAQGLLNQLPALINIRTERHHWHAGIGVDAPPMRDRLTEFKRCVPQAQQIEHDIEQDMEALWQEPLQKP